MSDGLIGTTCLMSVPCFGYERLAKLNGNLKKQIEELEQEVLKYKGFVQSILYNLN